MSPPLPSSRAGTTGRTAARGGGKLAAAAQRKRECEKLLAVVARSREPASDKAHAHEHGATPATPSSVHRASRLSHRSAEKLKQQTVIASVSSVFVTTPLPAINVILRLHFTQVCMMTAKKNEKIPRFYLPEHRHEIWPGKKVHLE
jgi:hypothetical protein